MRGKYLFPGRHYHTFLSFSLFRLEFRGICFAKWFYLFACNLNSMVNRGGSCFLTTRRNERGGRGQNCSLVDNFYKTTFTWLMYDDHDCITRQEKDNDTFDNFQTFHTYLPWHRLNAWLIKNKKLYRFQMFAQSISSEFLRGFFLETHIVLQFGCRVSDLRSLQRKLSIH